MKNTATYRRQLKKRQFSAAREWRQRLAGWGVGVLLVGMLGLVLSGIIIPDAPRKIWLTLTHWAGFEIRAVYVIGRQKTTRDDILAAIDIQIGEPLFRVEPEAMRQAIENIGAVKAARVERRLDGSILLHLEERSPHALWRHADHHYLVDSDGTVFGVTPVPTHTASVHAQLPVLIGQQAAEQAGDLFAAFRAVSEIGTMTAQAINHHGRRWDLHLRNGTILHLPGTDITAYLQQIQALNQHHDLLKRDIQLIDLRQPERIRIMKGIAGNPVDHVVPDGTPVDPDAALGNHLSPDHTQSGHEETRT